MLSAFQGAPHALDVVGRAVRSAQGHDRFTARGGIGESNALVHDAGQLAAVLAQLLFGLAGEARVRRSAIDDEDAPNGLSPKLFPDLVRLIERAEGLGYRPKVKRARLDGEHRDVGRDGGTLRDVAESWRAVEEDVVVSTDDLREPR